MMKPEELANTIEAILFVLGDSVSLKELAASLEVSDLEMKQAADLLRDRYDLQHSGICLKQYGERIQLATRSDFSPFIEKVLQPVQKQALSKSALETLSIVAYRQPVTKLEIEAIRGVKCDYAVQSLVGKNLICEVGRKEALGRPILYGTTEKFLEHFGLERLEELPELPEKETDPDDMEEASIVP